MVLPFRETYQNVLEVMCSASCNPLRRVKDDGCQTFFRDATEDDLEQVQRWLDLVNSMPSRLSSTALSAGEF
jgi:hypothetical protein